MSRPRTVRAQITKIDTALNTIAHNTAMITPNTRADTAPLNVRLGHPLLVVGERMRVRWRTVTEPLSCSWRPRPYPITPNDFRAHSDTITRIRRSNVGTIQHKAAYEHPQHLVATSSSMGASCPRQSPAY